MYPVSFGQTDVGRKRPHNEDSFFRDDALGLYVVADGMGGHAAGEVASAESVDQIHGMVKRGFGAVDAIREEVTDPNRQAVRRLIESAVQAATYMVFSMAELEPERKGMGTTISSMLVGGNRAFVAQVGDSRVYLVRDGRAIQITEDHTWVNWQVKIGAMTREQAAVSPRANAITRAVGIRDYVDVDTFEIELKPGDHFLLCSDGLHGYFSAEADVADTLGRDGLPRAAQRFIDLANNRGGKDNITVVLVEIRDGPGAAIPATVL
ncbi:MAG: PP2C family serine/threonine-protein phosphatase [Pseudomonadota bacterium]